MTPSIASAVPIESSAHRVWRTFQATLTVATVILGFVLIFVSRHVLFCLFTGIVIATALRSLVGRLRHRGWSIGQAATIVYSGIVALVIGILALPMPIVILQVERLWSALPSMYAAAREHALERTAPALRKFVERMPESLDAVVGQASGPNRFVAAVAEQIDAQALAGGLLATLGVLILAFYWTLHEERTVRSMLLWVPALKRDATRDFIDAVLSKTGAFVRGQALLCLIVGMLSLIAFRLIGLPHVFALALMAGVFEAVPVFGPILGAGPALLVASTLGFEQVLWTAAAAFIIQQLENHILLPRVMSRAVGVNSLVTLLAMAAFGTLFGFAGLLLAIPLAALIQLLLDRFLLGREALVGALPTGRDRISRLRLEAVELAQDARERFRRPSTETTDGDKPTTESRDWAETIEALAADLERALAEESRSAVAADESANFDSATLNSSANGSTAPSPYPVQTSADPLQQRPLIRLAIHAVVVVATLTGLALLWPLRGVLLLFAAAVALAAALAPIVERLRNRGWPQAAAVGAAYVPTIALMIAMVGFGARPLANEISRVAEQVVAASERWPSGEIDAPRLYQSLFSRESTVGNQEKASPEMQLTQDLFGATAGLMTLMIETVVVIVISIYWLIDHNYFERLWLSVVSARHRTAAREAWQDIELEVGSYVRSETLQMFAAALLLAVGYRVLGHPLPLLAALCGGLLWLLPWVGVLLAVAAIALTALPLLIIDGLSTYLWAVTPSALFAATVLWWLEMIVEPRLFARRRYNTLFMAVAALALAEAMGLFGLVLGPPVAIAAEILVAHALRWSVAVQTAVHDAPLSALSRRLESVMQDFAAAPNLPQELVGMSERLRALVHEARTVATPVAQ